MKNLPAPAAFILTTLGSLFLAIMVGLAGATAGVYLYDRGHSKGNDLAVALISFHAAGTFVFVTVFTLFWSRSRNISSRTPVACLIVCLCLLAFTTVLFWASYDEYYAPFFFVAWLAVAAAGGAALVVSRNIRLRALRQSGGGPDRPNSL